MGSGQRRCEAGGVETGFCWSLPAPSGTIGGGLPAEFVLFGEDASRILLSCDPESVARIQQTAGKHGIYADVIGETIPERLEISIDGRVVVSAEVSDLNQSYESALEPALRADAELVAAD